MATEYAIIQGLREATTALLAAKKEIDKMSAHISRLSSERDLFSSEAEHWRGIAYKLAQPKE